MIEDEKLIEQYGEEWKKAMIDRFLTGTGVMIVSNGEPKHIPIANFMIENEVKS